MHKISFRPLATLDLAEILEFYDTLPTNFSENFISELDACVQILLKKSRGISETY